MLGCESVCHWVLVPVVVFYNTHKYALNEYRMMLPKIPSSSVVIVLVVVLVIIKNAVGLC